MGEISVIDIVAILYNEKTPLHSIRTEINNYFKQQPEEGWRFFEDLLNHAIAVYDKQTSPTEVLTNKKDYIQNHCNKRIPELKKEEADLIEKKENEKEKLHWEAFIAKWKAKTFWYFFAFGICGVISLGMQVYDKLTEQKSESKSEHIKDTISTLYQTKKVDSMHISKNVN